MAIVLPNLCGAPITASQGARWWKSACQGRLALVLGSGTYSPLRYVMLEITGIGSTYKAYRQDKVATTICTSPTGYMAPFSSGDLFGATIDVWAAWRDAAWASSLAITYKEVSNGVGSNMHYGRYYIQQGDGSLTDYAQANLKTATNAADNCALTPPNSWTITVYDDGAISIA